MDWDAPTLGDAAWTAGDSWGFDDSCAVDDAWGYDGSWGYDDTWESEDGWWYDDAWGQGDTWVQDVVGGVTPSDIGSVDVGTTGQDPTVDVVVGAAEPADTTTIEVAVLSVRDLPGEPPVVPCLPPVDVELPVGVIDESDAVVVTVPDCELPGPLGDESFGSSDDGEIVVCPWLPPEVDSGLNDLTAEGEEGPNLAGGIDVEIGGGTTDESWVVADTVVDAADLDTAVVVVAPPAVPETDVAVPRVTEQAAPAGIFRAWGTFFFQGLGQASSSSDAAAGLQTPGQPGSGRLRIRLPFRPVV